MVKRVLREADILPVTEYEKPGGMAQKNNDQET